jgi:hypothetical protein
MPFLMKLVKAMKLIRNRSFVPLHLLILTLTMSGFRDQSTSDEYKVKAVFLFHFAQFVEWPASVFADAQSPIVIGVLGEDPFGNYLDETVFGEKVNDRPLVVNRYQRASDIQNCHILFVSKSVKEKQDEIIQTLKGKRILTVSDLSGFAKSGGMIRFVNEENKIKIRINLDAAKAEGLTISSKLLRIAEIVKPQN